MEGGADMTLSFQKFIYMIVLWSPQTDWKMQNDIKH